MNRRLADTQSNKITPGTPNTRIEGSIVSSGIGMMQEATTTPLSESRDSSESGTARSGRYKPGQYSSASYGVTRGSGVGLQGAQIGGVGISGGFEVSSLNIPSTAGRMSGNLTT